jgi:hypothetical protein
LAVPVAIWEIILMPIWLFAKGFNTAGISAKEVAVSGKTQIEPAII